MDFMTIATWNGKQLARSDDTHIRRSRGAAIS